MKFEDQLAVGRIAESSIVKWLRSRGNSVITVYEIEHKEGGGPRFLAPTKAYVAPDVLVFSGNRKVMWCETKHKTTFSWYGIGSRWTTGIDLRHYEDYQNVAAETGLPVWLVFLHSSSKPSDKDIRRFACPIDCPVGLFGESLDRLVLSESHRSQNHGRSGMVYWAHESLRLLASLEEVNSKADEEVRLQGLFREFCS